MNTRNLGPRVVPIAAGLAICAVIASAAVVSVAQSTRFRDVPANHWAAQSVDKLTAVGIIKGYPSAPFAAAQTPAKASGYNGEKPVTRYELAVTLYRFVQYVERANKQPKGKLPIKGEPKSGAEAVKSLVAAGYLPANTPLAADGGKVVTAKQLSEALAKVIMKTRETAVPASPDSDLNIEKPQDFGV
ncbi:MAG: S-layer homology domain-containing protein [Armatimonadota bacterium]